MLSLASLYMQNYKKNLTLFFSFQTTVRKNIYFFHILPGFFFSSYLAKNGNIYIF